MPISNLWRASIAGVLLLAAFGKAGHCVGCCVAPQAFCPSIKALEDDGVRLNSVDRVILALILAESNHRK